MTISNIEKINKLLALGKSDNEHEAKAAMLKARELMVKYKLSEADLNEQDSIELIDLEDSGLKCSTRTDPWLLLLVSVIANNHRCKTYISRRHRAKTRRVHIVGFEDDVLFCVDIIYYAINCIRARQKEIRKSLKGYDNYYINSELISYGLGFATGLAKLYEQQDQKETEEWGLILKTPQAVNDFMNKKDMVPDHFNCNTPIYQSGYDAGLEDGLNFSPGDKLKDFSGGNGT